jgi:hypothetical protein
MSQNFQVIIQSLIILEFHFLGNKNQQLYIL